MGKRVEQREASAPDAKPRLVGQVTFPREGRFALLHDAASPLSWTLLIEGASAWDVPLGVPPRPDEARVVTEMEAGDIAPGLLLWDDGSFRAEMIDPQAAEVRFSGQRIAGRYALRWQGGGSWVLERLDPETLRPMPQRILPMLASSSPYPAREEQYAFEPKWDGIRAIAYVEGARVRLRSRNLRDLTPQYPELQSIAERLSGRRVVLDGEIVAFDRSGRASFQRLQARMGIVAKAVVEHKRVETPVDYVAFDILHLDGHDTTRLPYEERRALLESLDLVGPHVQVSPAFVGRGLELLKTPGLEGVVAKRLGSVYEPGARSRAWLKIKEQRRQELVIAGWTPGRGGRAGRIGALLVGYHDEPGGAFHYAGSVGTGFTDETLRDLEARLRPHLRETSPFAEGRVKKDAVYTEPVLVGEFEFTEWTDEGKLRHPSFKGLRADKEPGQVVREEDHHA